MTTRRARSFLGRFSRFWVQSPPLLSLTSPCPQHTALCHPHKLRKRLRRDLRRHNHEWSEHISHLPRGCGRKHEHTKYQSWRHVICAATVFACFINSLALNTKSSQVAFCFVDLPAQRNKAQAHIHGCNNCSRMERTAFSTGIVARPFVSPWNDTKKNSPRDD